MGLGDLREVERALGITREPRERDYSKAFGLVHHPHDAWPWSVDRRGPRNPLRPIDVAMCTTEEAAEAALRLLTL